MENTFLHFLQTSPFHLNYNVWRQHPGERLSWSYLENTVFSENLFLLAHCDPKRASQRSRAASFVHKVLFLAECTVGDTLDLFPPWKQSPVCGGCAKPHFWLSDKMPFYLFPLLCPPLPLTLSCPGLHSQLQSIYGAYAFITRFLML